MSEGFFQRALRDSVEEVLEKMFFVRTSGAAVEESASPESELAAQLSFEGDPSGYLNLRLTPAAARSISADFLGAEEADLSEFEIHDVICELANIICGSLLSRVESTSTFRLASPCIVPARIGRSGEESVHAIEIAGGALTVTVQMANQTCSTAEQFAF